MIHDLDRTIANVLPQEHGGLDLAISFEPPTREWKFTKPAINVFLYDVRENNQRRQYHWESVVDQKREVSRQQPPLYYDCTYLISCWVERPVDEHHLLTRCLRTLAGDPGLSKAARYGSLADVAEITTRLGIQEQLPALTDIWTALDNTLRPVLIYCVTLPIPFKPKPEETGLVHTVGFSWQQIRTPLKVNLSKAENGLANRPLTPKRLRTIARRTGLPQPGPRPERGRPEREKEPESYLIAGTIRDEGGEPVKNAEIFVEGGVCFALTDEHGRYRLGQLRPGDYTLVLRYQGSEVAKRQITLPVVNGQGGPFDLDVQTGQE